MQEQQQALEHLHLLKKVRNQKKEGVTSLICLA